MASLRHASAVALAASIAATVLAAPAHAANTVTYEVVANLADVPAANVEYNVGGERQALQQVPLPWRLNVELPYAVSPTRSGAEIRADWRPYRWPQRYVTVRIYRGAELLCESTLDVGDATCYGSAQHRNFPQSGGE